MFLLADKGMNIPSASAALSGYSLSTKLSMSILKLAKNSIEQQGDGILKMLDSIPEVSEISSESTIDISI